MTPIDFAKKTASTKLDKAHDILALHASGQHSIAALMRSTCYDSLEKMDDGRLMYTFHDGSVLVWAGSPETSTAYTAQEFSASLYQTISQQCERFGGFQDAE